MTDRGGPTTPTGAAVDAVWLTDVLRSSGAADGTITELRTEPLGVGIGLVGSLVRMRLTWTGGAGPGSVVIKFPASDEGSRFVARVLGMYRTEVGFYRDLGARAGIGPVSHFGHHDAASDDFVLVLEDLRHARAIDQLAGAAAADLAVAVDRLADLHAGFWSDDRLLAVDWLRSLDEPPFPDAVAMSFGIGWGLVKEVFGDDITPAVRDFGDRYGDLLPGMVKRLSEPPWTLSHGDYRADNFLFLGDDLTVCDWQLVDRSRGGRDLAYLLSQSVTPELRATLDRPMVERYAERLAGHGIDDYPLEAVLDDYRLAAAFAFAYPVVACGDINHDDQRAIDLCRSMLVRSVRAIEELDALSLL